jgi:hypothetical protein
MNSHTNKNKAESLIINSVEQRPTERNAYNPYGINRITPHWGLRLQGNSFHRALPRAIDLRAFSPMNLCESKRKAESLIINSVGHRPT